MVSGLRNWEVWLGSTILDASVLGTVIESCHVPE